ncbi:MAG: peptidoglycan editing factor PgeF [Bacteroidota bacterium]
MKIIKSELFNSIPYISFGMSTKLPAAGSDPFGFNLSYSICDDEKRVKSNRERFFNEIGLTSDQVAYHHQIHGDTIKIIDSAGFIGESDALVTSQKDLGLAITTADCTAIFIFDRSKEVIAGIHSGWRGTNKNILGKTLDLLVQKYNSKSENLFVFIAPAISQKNYEVGGDVATLFEEKYSRKRNDKFLLDVTAINYDILLDYQIPKEQIERSTLCSYDSTFLHSYRRDGKHSGRALGVIAMKGII